MIPLTDRERFLKKATIDRSTGCWVWTSSIDQVGYGYFNLKINGRWVKRGAHRIAYELFIGPIPDGLQLDHLCHDPCACDGGVTCLHRRCVNPWHLEPVTNRENAIRGAAPRVNRARMLASTVCSKGHLLDAMNTQVNSAGHRACRRCSREDTRRRSGSGIRGPRRRVSQWLTNNRAIAECGHEVYSKNGKRTRHVLCKACDGVALEGNPQCQTES